VRRAFGQLVTATFVVSFNYLPTERNGSSGFPSLRPPGL
jgi:hypothetical protein